MASCEVFPALSLLVFANSSSSVYRKGLQFYKDLTGLTKNLQDRVTSFITSRNRERESLAGRLALETRLDPGPVTPVAPSAPPALPPPPPRPVGSTFSSMSLGGQGKTPTGFPQPPNQSSPMASTTPMQPTYHQPLQQPPYQQQHQRQQSLPPPPPPSGQPQPQHNYSPNPAQNAPFGGPPTFTPPAHTPHPISTPVFTHSPHPAFTTPPVATQFTSPPPAPPSDPYANMFGPTSPFSAVTGPAPAPGPALSPGTWVPPPPTQSGPPTIQSTGSPYGGVPLYQARPPQAMSPPPPGQTQGYGGQAPQVHGYGGYQQQQTPQQYYGYQNQQPPQQQSPGGSNAPPPGSSGQMGSGGYGSVGSGSGFSAFPPPPPQPTSSYQYPR